MLCNNAMGDVNVGTTEIRCDLASSLSQNSPAYSAQSSPYSSAISESEIDVSSLSRHSSCSSLNQQNASLLASAAGNFTPTRQYSNGTPTDRSVFRTLKKRVELEGAARTRPACVHDSDDDGAADDSSSSCGLRFGCERRNTVEQSGMSWRAPSDIMANSTEPERKTSLPRNFTPSPSVSGRSSPACLTHPVPSHSRVANIRRESNCSMESEAAHERLMQIAQQVSLGFDDFCIGDAGERKRTHSLSEPISVLTNAFAPHSCSPSPTRAVDVQKQCYSPSTRQIVRNNITYSPSPSPTPSPTRRIMRSLSPIAIRQVTKRRYTSSTSGELDQDLRAAGVISTKRVCQQPYIGSRVCVSPLALENPTSSVDSSSKSPELSGPFSSPFLPSLLVDPAIDVKLPPPMEMDEEGNSVNEQRTAASEVADAGEITEAPSLKKDS